MDRINLLWTNMALPPSWWNSEQDKALGKSLCCDTTQLRSSSCQESRPEAQAPVPSLQPSSVQKSPAIPVLKDFSSLSTNPSLPISLVSPAWLNLDDLPHLPLSFAFQLWPFYLPLQLYLATSGQAQAGEQGESIKHKILMMQNGEENGTPGCVTFSKLPPLSGPLWIH